jgi:hypothetical protein
VPHGRRERVVVDLRNGITVIRTTLVRVVEEAVGSISRPQNVDPDGSWASHTSGDTMWSSHSRMIDERGLRNGITVARVPRAGGLFA